MNLKSCLLPLKSRLGRDILWTLTAQMLIMLCALLINKILSNKLSVEDFGQYNIIKRSASVLSFVMLGGVGIALPRYLPIYVNNGKFLNAKCFIISVFLFVGIISIAVCSIGFLCRDKLLPIIVGNNDFSLYQVVYIYAFMVALSSILYAYYRGIGNFRLFNLSQILYQIVLLCPLFLISSFSVKYIFLIWICLYAVLIVILGYRELYLKKFRIFCDVKIKLLVQELKTVFVYASPRLIGDFFLFSFSAFPLLYLSYFSDMKEVAYYSVGMTFVTMSTPIFSFLGVVLLPYVSTCFANNEIEKASILVNKLLLLYLFISVIIIVVLWFGMPFFIHLFFSDSYYVTTNLSRILVLAILPQSLYLLFRNPIDAISIVPYNTIILGISFTLLIFFFINLSTLIQYAYAYVLVSVVQGGISLGTWYFFKIKSHDI